MMHLVADTKTVWIPLQHVIKTLLWNTATANSPYDLQYCAFLFESLEISTAVLSNECDNKDVVKKPKHICKRLKCIHRKQNITENPRGIVVTVGVDAGSCI